MAYVIYLNDCVFSVVPDLHTLAVVLSMIDDTDCISPDFELSVLPISVDICDMLGGLGK